jgi:urease accessory protein
VVVGQSATRIHPSLRGFATQQWRIRVESGAVLVVLPGPAIPFQGCRYFQRVAVELDPGAGFVWGDVWLPGRYARGADSESFRFDRLIQAMTVVRGNRLAFRDRFCWRGPWDAADSRWHFGGATAAGSLFATGPAVAAPLVGELALNPAEFATAVGDRCVRWCGPAEAVTAAVVHTALATAALLAGGSGHDGWIPTNGLAPAHWFSPGCTLPVPRQADDS